MDPPVFGGEGPAREEAVAPAGWYSAEWPLRRTVVLREERRECLAVFDHHGLVASEGRDLRVIGPDGKPTDFLIKDLALDSVALVFNSSPGPGTYRIYYGNADDSLSPPPSGLMRTEGSAWKPKGGYRGVVYGARHIVSRQSIRSFDDTKKTYDRIKKLTTKSEANPSPISVRDVVYRELADTFEDYGIIEADIFIPEAGGYVFGEGELRMSGSLRVLVVDDHPPVIRGWFDALSGGVVSPEGQGKIRLNAGHHKLTFYAAGRWELKIAKEGRKKLEFETLAANYCHFPEAAEGAVGEAEVIPGESLPRVCLSVAGAATASKQFTRAKRIHTFIASSLGDADLRTRSLKALDDLEFTAYQYNWMVEGKTPARTSFADEAITLPMRHVGGVYLNRSHSYGIEGLTVAYGKPYMASPFRLGPEPWPLTSPPAVYEGVLYAGGKDCYLYACDLARKKILWRFLSGGPIYGGPVVYRDNVYFCSLDGKLYALERQRGRMLWNYPTRDWIEGAPAIAEGRVFIASSDGHLYCVDAESGVLRWRFPADGALPSTPAVYNGTVYIGSEAGTMHAVDAATGKLRWKRTGHGSVVGAAVGAGRVVFTTRDGKLHSLNAATGQPFWPGVDLGAPVKSPPIIVGSVAFAGNVKGEIKGIDLEAGSAAWSDKVRFGVEIVKPLAFMAGRLYVPAGALRGRGGYTIFGPVEGK